MHLCAFTCINAHAALEVHLQNIVVMDAAGIGEELETFLRTTKTLLDRFPSTGVADAPEDPMVGIFRQALHTSMLTTAALMEVRGTKRKMSNDSPDAVPIKRVRLEAPATREAVAESVALPTTRAGMCSENCLLRLFSFSLAAFVASLLSPCWLIAALLLFCRCLLQVPTRLVCGSLLDIPRAESQSKN